MTGVDVVCLVPDVPTFFEAVSAWDDTRYFPVLIDDVEAMHAKMVKSVLMGLGAIGLILLVAAFFVTRSIVGPLGRLTGSLERLAGGDIEADVAGARRSDEFGTIARAAIGVREAVRTRAQPLPCAN